MTRSLHKDQEKRLFYDTFTFRSLLDSLARPGKINRLLYPDFLGAPPAYISASKPVPLNLYALGAMLALLDKEVSFAIIADGQWQDAQAEAARWLALRSGASVASVVDADFALFCNGDSATHIRSLNMGTLLEPELSATAIYCVEQLAMSMISGDHLSIELRGPGIAERTMLQIAGLASAELEHINAMRQSYPLGVDIYLIDAEGHCVGLPRTTRIQKGQGSWAM